MSTEIVKKACATFGVTEEEYLKMKEESNFKDIIFRIMEFSGIDEESRVGIILSSEESVNNLEVKHQYK